MFTKAPVIHKSLYKFLTTVVHTKWLYRKLLADFSVKSSENKSLSGKETKVCFKEGQFLKVFVTFNGRTIFRLNIYTCCYKT